ncbi:MAG: replicative DNA helicase [Campylobacteraceae bacterium 4484_166]|nr:MAG: replicative DNA helicase [Campylobacteraceae bacterium 4484_166]
MDQIYKINIERSVLSSILFDNMIIEDVLGVLKSTDFYLPAHKKLFEIMQKLHNEDLPIDEDFIRKKSSTDELDDEILLEIISANPISNIKAYIAEIKDSSVKRELSALAHTIQKEVENENNSSINALDIVQNELYKISTDSASVDIKDMPTIVQETLDHIKLMKTKGDSYLIGETTGFVELDKNTTGFGGGDLVIIAARPSMGKTAFMLNIAEKNLNIGKGVILFSLEMPTHQLLLRILSSKTSIPLQDLRMGKLDDIQLTQMTKAMDELNQLKLWVDDGSSLNINQLRARVRKIAQKKENNISMVMIDYLQLMQGTSTKDRHIEVSEISRGLKMLARELNIPIVALSQLNRGLESRPDKRPMLSDLRESGSIEQDADIIMFIYRDDVYREREENRKEKEARAKGDKYISNFRTKIDEEAEIIIGKQRNGPIGTVKLIFQKNKTRFIDDNSKYSPTTTEFSEQIDTNMETKMDISMPGGL